jgi:hypothetical protein
MRRENEGTVLSLDFEALSLFRILFSVYLLSEFYLAVYPFFADFYSNSGVLPISTLAADSDRPDSIAVLPFLKIVSILQSPLLFAALYSTTLFSFAIGYQTRWSNALAFVLNSYLYWRNPYVVSGAEELAHLLLLWCLFLPMARYWSIDAALAAGASDRPYPILPFIALRVQIASVYLFAALFKIAGSPWRNGVAVTWSLSDNIFGATVPALFLVEHAPGLLYGVNYIVIAFQLAFPFLVYCPLRNDIVRATALLCAVLMHASFVFFLNVGGFPYLSLVMLMLLVPDSWIDRLLDKRRRRLAGITIYYEPGCDFCRRVSLLLRQLLLCPTSTVTPASADPKAHKLLIEWNSWVVRDPDGIYYLKWHAMNYLLKQNPLLGLSAWLFERKSMRKLMNQFYDYVGKNRKRLAGITRIIFRVPPPDAIGQRTLVLCGFLMILAFLSNIFALTRVSFPVLRSFNYVPSIFQVRQSWKLFAPVPVHFHHDYNILVYKTDGSMVDLNEHLPTPLFYVAENSRLIFASPRWAKYFTLFDEFTADDWKAFGQYLCRLAQNHERAHSVRQVEITLITESAKNTPPFLKPQERRAFECLSSGAE